MVRCLDARHVLLLSLLLVAGCGHQSPSGSPPTTLTIFVAASTKEPIDEIARAFQAESGISVVVSAGPSSGLAKQIEQGAAADLFLSADQATADFLAEKHLIVKQCNLLTNRLVVITPANEELELKSLADVADARITRLALAEPAVPAGKYGRQALGNAKVWDRVASKVVGGIDVRATLQFVARREVEAGIVYYTDAVGSSGVRIALEIPQELHEPIIYPLALVERQPKQDAAVRLFEYLQSDKATTMFQQHHFGKAK